MECVDLSVIPQFGGTCWFNAILMIVLYSQETRKVLIKTSKNWDKNNKFLMILKAILIKYYNKPNKIQILFNKIKPEIILFKMIKTYNDKTLISVYKNNLKKNIADLGWFDNYIVKIIRYLNLKCLDITYYNNTNTYLINFDKVTSIVGNNNGAFKLVVNKDNMNVDKLITETRNELKEIPDIIIVFHNKLNNFVTLNNINNYLTLSEREKEIFNPEKNKYQFETSGIETYDDIIYVNGISYKLDATTLVNYDNAGMNHAIAGITCNDNHYVYNGWNQQSTDPAMNIKGLKNSSPCSLIKYNWNLKKDDNFCLNPITCKLDFLQPNQYANLCFSFAKGLRTLVYVRLSDYEESKIKSVIEKKLEISNVSEIIKEFHDFKNLTNQEIVNQLNNFGIFLDPNFKYERSVLESLLYDELKKYYNINSSYKSSSIKPSEKSIKSPEKSIKNLEELIKSPEKSIKSPEKLITIPKGLIKSNNTNLIKSNNTNLIKSPEKSIKIPEGLIKSSEKSIKPPEESIKPPEESIKPHKNLNKFKKYNLIKPTRIFNKSKKHNLIKPKKANLIKTSNESIKIPEESINIPEESIKIPEELIKPKKHKSIKIKKHRSIKIPKQLINTPEESIKPKIYISIKPKKHSSIKEIEFNYEKLIKLKKNELIKLALLKHPNINFIYKTKQIIIEFIIGKKIKKENKIKETKLDLLIRVKSKYPTLKGLVKLNKKQLYNLLYN